MTGVPGPASVWHFSWEFPPIVYGGLARHVDALSSAQAAAGLAVTVLTSAEDVLRPSAADLPASSRHGSVEVLRAARPSPRLPWSDLIGAAGQLTDALTSTAMLAASVVGEGAPAELGEEPFDDGSFTDGGPGLPEVVHAHDWSAAGAATTVATGLGVPLVLTIHATEHGRRAGRIGPDDGGGPMPALVHEVELRAVEDADVVIVCSTAMREEVVTVLGADPARVHVVPNAVDVGAWTPDPALVAATRARFDGPLIVAAGRLEWEKGFSTLIRALPAVLAVQPDARVVLAGRGSYEPVLRKLAAEVGVAHRVDFPGWLDRPDLAALYAAADVVVVPSRYEPSGLVAREAQAAGALVAAASTGGLTDVVLDGLTGHTFAPGDVDHLAEIILSPDPALAAAGHAAVRARTWSDVAHDTLHAYAAGTLPERHPMC